MAPVRSLRILLVEDNPINRRVASCLLERQGHIVVIAEDGPSALNLHGQDQFDLVLMDVQMPGMDGFQTTAAIREKERSSAKRTPIVALTANSDDGSRERCRQAGMDGYVAKPVQINILLQTIHEVLKTA